ncbi:MAG: hypothetical protein ABIQ70_01395 [Dokdonella sp.]
MPTILNGSTQAVTIAPGYRLQAPGWKGTAAVQMPSAATARATARGIDGGLDALEVALRETHVTESRQIDLVLQATPASKDASRTRGLSGPQDLVLEVPPVDPGYGQLILSIDDLGAMRWHLPEDDAAVSPALSRSAGGQRFRIPANLVPPIADDADTTKQRSILGAVGRRLLKVLVYPLTDPVAGAVLEFFAQRWEAAKRPYRLRSFTPTNYRNPEAAALASADIAAMAAKGPVLLYVHGTFSTSHGGFGDLPEATVSELHRRYEGRVIAFDHPTLSADPTGNVRWLLSQLPKVPMKLDIICHSRGGLVSRVLAEAPGSLNADAAHVTVRRIVLGAVPNNGTLLSDPDHMVNMIDRLTTALSMFPASGATEILEGLITLVKILGHAGLKGIEGLQSMLPNGKFLQMLNAKGGQPGEYFAIAANYEPTDRGLRALVSGAVDAIVDQVFGNAGNDLVVPTDGVYEKNGNARFPVPLDKLLLLDPAWGVMHTSVFKHPLVSEKLLAWLA